LSKNFYSNIDSGRQILASPKIYPYEANEICDEINYLYLPIAVLL